VCVALCQVNKRIILFWKTNTIPIRALKRRKLFVMTGRENAGRATCLDGRGSDAAGVPSSMSSVGITLSRSLAKSLSCMEELPGLVSSFSAWEAA